MYGAVTSTVRRASVVERERLHRLSLVRTCLVQAVATLRGSLAR